ncbi:MAG TPA: SpoIIE family protein phosphatase [Bryobacteraceae bacterium]|nr:SpoIIE family protein phosphatase [Bryobacteraceae bacterium]
MKRCLFFALAVPLFAQFPLYLDLAGDWRFNTADNPAFADPALDDHDWSVFPLPRRDDPPFGSHWLRKRVHIPEGANTSRLAFTFGPFIENYEVFVNGRRIGANGEYRLSATHVVRPRTFEIPGGLCSAGSDLTIAIRFWRMVYNGPSYRNFNGIPDEGPYLLSDRSNVPANPAALGMERRDRLAVTDVAAGVFDLVIISVVLLTWFSDRSRTELLYLAGFLLTECLHSLPSWLSLALDWSHGVAVIFGPTLTATGPFLLLLAARVCERRIPRWLGIAIWIPTLGHAAINCLVLLRDGDYTGLSGTYEVLAIGIDAVDLICLWMLGALLLGARRDAISRFLAIAIGVVTILHVPNPFVAGGPRLLTAVWQGGGFRLSAYYAAYVVLALAITTLLFRRIAADRREKLRLAEEMAAAGAVQRLLFTGATEGIDAVYHPATEVGGDFYQVLPLHGGDLLVAVGDVSGKGLKAAMVVSMVVGVLRSHQHLAPSALLGQINRTLVGSLDGGFVTCIAARIDGAGRCVLANAGHLQPYADGHEVALHGGLPLGVAADAMYPETEVRAASFTFVSDGVVEAANGKRELFGFDRTRTISAKPAREIAEAARAWGQNDDITVVTVRRSA